MPKNTFSKVVSTEASPLCQARGQATVVGIRPRLLSPIDAGRYIAKSARWLKGQRAQDRIRVKEEGLPALPSVPI